MNAIAVFDVGKTNKKLFLLDDHYRVVSEQSVSLAQTTDEDGDACEDVTALTEWVRGSLSRITSRPDTQVRAVNVAAYGASFVHVGGDGRPVTPLYNYLKSYPDTLRREFYDKYGGEGAFSLLTASPVLGSLNSGMQLYRLRREKPALFARIRYSLHLPQYLSYLVTGKPVSEITSIGCHTNLWNFSQHHYHEWVYREGVAEKLAPVVPSDRVFPAGARLAGVGLHDSSAAIIPYLERFPEPFALISTGTWCITMNPFNNAPLTAGELQQDCLCYMSYQGRPVKASRLFAGYDHEQQVRRLADHFQRPPDAAAAVRFDPACMENLRARVGVPISGDLRPVTASVFARRDLAAFEHFEQAYHCLLMDIMEQQVRSVRLVLDATRVRRIFVDGGFGRNDLYMHLLAEAFPGMEVFASSVSQATAIGAALAIHRHWNAGPVPEDIIELKRYG
ncbi:MAG TPA: FGGY family carbohydrate kinase [Puia sp.]|nr:FGGY family carbohydrate kinase [Puia sp.]